MMMSVFRQGRPTSQLDHIACLKLAATEHDLDLITFAFLNGKAVLTALDGVPAIVKLEETGDAGHTFESLYDNCVTLRDLTRMKAHKVQSTDALGPVRYELELIAEINFIPRVLVRIKALNEVALRARLRELVNEEDFREQLTLELVNQILISPEVSMVSTGGLKIDDPAPADKPEWEIISRVS
jgi:hypothetical protein